MADGNPQSAIRNPQSAGEFAGRHLYVWMVRDKPRGREVKPGPWRPFVPPAMAMDGADSHGPKHLLYCTGLHNTGDAREEHAVFRVPVEALERFGTLADGR